MHSVWEMHDSQLEVEGQHDHEHDDGSPVMKRLSNRQIFSYKFIKIIPISIALIRLENKTPNTCITISRYCNFYCLFLWVLL